MRDKRIKGMPKAQADRFRIISTMVSDVLFEYDIASDRMMNQRCIGFDVTEEIYIDDFTKRMSGFVYLEDLDVYYKMMEEMQSGCPMIEAEFRMCYHSTVYQWVSIQGRTLKEPNGQAVKVVGRIYSVDSRKRQELKLLDDTKRDSMTKLFNKIYMEEQIGTLLEEEQKLSAFLMIDVDNFKRMNDTLGHLLGDEILLHAVNKIRSSFRTQDLIGRVGGDEFLVFMYDIDNVQVAEARAESLCESLSQIYVGEGQEVGISVSIGIALSPVHGNTYKELFQKADQAMYYSKKKGKGRYTVYEVDNQSMERLDARSFARKKDNFYTTYGKANRETFDSFGYTLIDTAFGLLENAKNVDSAMNILIQKAMDNYKLSFLSIMVLGKRPHSMQVLYEYRKEGGFSAGGKEIFLSEGEWEEITESGEDHILVCSNVTGVQLERQQNPFYEKAQSWVLVSLYRENHFLGCICFADDYARVWFRKELHTFQLFSRMISSYVLNMRDYELTFTMVKEMSKKDSLTGLYRYEAFLEHLNTELEKKREDHIVIVYSDIRHFKYINDTYGYDTGERLIKDVAYELAGRDMASKLCGCRVYSDNIIMALVVNKSIEHQQIIKDINALIYSIEHKFQSQLMDSQFQINTGIYFVGEDDQDAKQVVSNANYARKQAKRRTKRGCMVFDDQMMERLRVRMNVIADFPRAIRKREIKVYYQPKNACGTGQVIGAEALVRWERDGKIIYFPDQFVPVLEENGMVIDLDYYVFREVFVYIRKRLDARLSMFPVSVNVSRGHLKNDMIFLYFEHLFEEYEIPKEYLEIELTESLYMDNEELMIPFIQRFKKMGIQVSMDDFGSGFSSLNELSRFPIDILKLDKVFLHGDTFGEQDRIVIGAVVGMAKKLHLTVLCEGVETKEQYEFLSGVGCDICQGYYFNRPLPEQEFERYLKRELEKEG